MKIIESNDVLESFGMKELTVDDLFDVSGGACFLNKGCKSKNSCKDNGGGPIPCSCNGPQGNITPPCNCNGGTNQCIGTSYGC